MKEKKEGKIHKRRGLRVQVLNIFMITVIFIMAAVLVYSNYRLKRAYDYLVQLQNEYKSCEKAAQTLRTSVDNMRQRAQCFSQTGDKMDMVLYFRGYVSGDQQKAIDELKATEKERKVLEQALDEQERVMEIEYHIIRLTASAYSVRNVVTTQEFQDYHLSKAERYLVPAKKSDIARSLAYGTQYMQYQRDISSHIKTFSKMVLDRHEKEVEDYENHVSTVIMQQYLVIAVLVVVVLFFAWLYHFQVAKVLRKFVRWIREDRFLEASGVRELRYLATAYNENAEKKKQEKQRLTIRADYDALTGLANRGAFEKYVGGSLSGGEPPASSFLLVDVDKFKQVNDGYGHDIGDIVLKTVAGKLKDRFHDMGVVGRLGGDEFAVWLEDTHPEDSSDILDRIRGINEELTHPEEGFPLVSLSVGISYAKQGDDFKAVYKRSDRALYTVKENGRCGAAVYDEQESD